MASQLGNHDSSDLSEQQEVALDLADYFLGDPRGMDAELCKRAVAALSPEQAVELAFLLLKTSAFSKVTMALGLEPEGMETTVLSFTDAGWADPAEEGSGY